MIRRLGLLAAALLTAPLLMAGAATAADLAPPFDLARQRALHGRPIAEQTCPPVPSAVIDVIGESFYADKAYSIPDPAKVARNNELSRALRLYMSRISGFADRYLASRPAEPGAARCALAWLDGWARAGAMLGSVNPQGAYERHWALGGIAMAFLKIQAEPSLDANSLGRVRAWLVRVAQSMMPEYQRPRSIDNRNNHAYWAGLSAAAVGIAAQDRGLFDWGMARYRTGIGEIAPDGTLPLEMARGQRAFHYHLFALTPLVMLAELGEANGLQLYAERDGALHRLAERAAAGLADAQSFAIPAGAIQEWPEHPDVSDFAWLEPYCARFPGKPACAYLGRWRPIRDSRTGGDAGLAFARMPLQ